MFLSYSSIDWELIKGCGNMTEDSFRVRLAVPEDAESLLTIYRQYINTPVTFEYVLPSQKEFTERMEGIIGEYPYLVCELCGEAAGYAYAHRHMERAAYQWNAELSIYIRREFVSCGIGRLLYGILMDILKTQGVKNVYGGVTLPNRASEGLHESMGFERIGVYSETGYKCGGWHDVCWFEKRLEAVEKEPEPIVSVRDLPPGTVSGIIEERLKAFDFSRLSASAAIE